mgnify:CR=1 FL=1|tara:strand:+ start:4202 stop:5449 length:1248 start_codon:yes stop_codon:yes gene_type:complete
MTDAPRSRLLGLLSAACELEHALGCSYLYAAFSIKTDTSEHITWQEQQLYREWASRIYHVAAQEMLHLGQAWNLITALGGSPYIRRPSFPQPAKWFQLPVALSLRRFDERTLDRFVYYENPVEPTPGTDAGGRVSEKDEWPDGEAFEFGSVGELYEECRRLIELLGDEAIINVEELQATRATVHFPDIIPVTSVESAIAAIDRIVDQGEGTPHDREDSHFAVFRTLRAQFGEHVASIGASTPARPVAENPYLKRRRNDAVVAQDIAGLSKGLRVTEISDPHSAHVADLFDDAYVAMLQALAVLFCRPGGSPAMTVVSLQLMVTVIKPLGECLSILPSGEDGMNAGACFSMGRAPLLSPTPLVAELLLRERLAELASRGEDLLNTHPVSKAAAADRLRSAVYNLRRLSQILEDHRS